MEYDVASAAQAVKYRKLACTCTRGQSWSCIVLARAEADHKKAMKLFERACDLDATSCLWLADELDPDDPRVRELIERAGAAGVRRGILWTTPTGGGFIPE